MEFNAKGVFFQLESFFIVITLKVVNISSSKHGMKKAKDFRKAIVSESLPEIKQVLFKYKSVFTM